MSKSKYIRLHGAFGNVGESEYFYGSQIASAIDHCNEYEPEYDEIDLGINSLGGGVQDLLTIVSAIARSKKPVNTFIEGYAYSSGGFLALCGKKRRAFLHASFMLHNPFPLVNDDLDETQKKQVEVNRQQLISLVATCSGMKPEKVEAFLKEEQFLTAYQAKEMGLIDEVIEVNFKAEGDDRMKMVAYSNFAKEYKSNSNNKQKPNAKMDENKQVQLDAILAYSRANDARGVLDYIRTLEDKCNKQEAIISDLVAKNEERERSEIVARIEDAIQANLIDANAKDSWLSTGKQIGLKQTVALISTLKPVIAHVEVDKTEKNPANEEEKQETPEQEAKRLKKELLEKRNQIKK